MGLRERKRARTAETIVAAAFELFASKGYAATTVDDIAEMAEVSRATVFRYFPSKDDIVFSHYEFTEELLCDACDRHAGRGSYATVVRKVVAEFAENLATVDENMRLRLSIIESDRRLLGRSLAAEADWVRTIVTEIAGETSTLAQEVVAAVTMRAARVALRVWSEVGPGSGDFRPVLTAAIDSFAIADR